jgi:hypothetical protein
MLECRRDDADGVVFENALTPLDIQLSQWESVRVNTAVITYLDFTQIGGAQKSG